MANKEIVPIGLSGNCVELFEVLADNFHIPAILDDGKCGEDAHFEGVPVLPLSAYSKFAESRFVFLIGSDRSYRARAGLIGGLGLARDRFATIVHPQARVSRFAEMGQGAVLYAGVTVTSNAHIGDHVMIMPHAVVHHDVTIGAHSLVGAGVILAGSVEVGDSCYIGSGSAIRNGTTIGAGALVGMGSVVVRDVAPGAVVAGNPARALKGRGG